MTYDACCFMHFLSHLMAQKMQIFFSFLYHIKIQPLFLFKEASFVSKDLPEDFIDHHHLFSHLDRHRQC
jgi:hypothetical protein